MKPRYFRPIVATLAFISFTATTHAATITKADNTSSLDLGISWGGAAPGAGDVANWSGTYNTSGALAAGLPASALTWQGISVGALSGSAAGTISIGGTGAPTALSSLSVGASGISLTGSSHDLVINAETLNLSGSQTWTVPTGRNLRFGANVATSNVDGAGGDATVITVAGGGTVDGNQGAANGFTDFTGKWIVEANTMLRGIGTGTASWGSNTSANAITLNGGKLAVGAVSGSLGALSWPSSITLGTATTSTITGQHLGTGIPDLTLQGAISGDGDLVIDKASGTSLIARLNRADSSYTGTTTINSGASGSIAVYAHLGTAAGTKTPFGSGDVTINGASSTTAAVELTTDATTTASNAILSINNKFNLNNATLRTREGRVDLNGDINLTGSNVIQGLIDLRDITIYGIIDGAGSVNFRTTGLQKMILPYPNTYTGGTTLGAGSGTGTGTANVGVVLLGDSSSLGSGTIAARGMQIQSSVADLVLTNTIQVGSGGLCFGGSNNISLDGSITVNDNSTRLFQNSGTGMITLTGISVNAGTNCTATFGSTTAKGAFAVTGAVTGSGKVTINGGTVTLSGTSTYTGTTTVQQAGRLNLTGSLASAIIMTGAGASIQGSGSTTGNLTATGVSGGTIYLDPANPTQAVTAATVAINGPTKVELLTQQPLGTTNYTVLKYTGAFSGLGNLSSSITRGVFTDDAINKKINFAATSAIRTWNAASTTVWNTADSNWVEGDNKFFAGDSVVFDDTAPGALSISGVVSPSQVTFNNSTGNDYTLTSAASNQIGGATGLTKSGTGAVTLVGPNTFTGKTTISGGTLAIRTESALGATPSAPVADQITLAGGTLKLAPSPAAAMTLGTNRGITLSAGSSSLDTTSIGNDLAATVAGDITGTGSLTIFANGDTSDTGGGVPGHTYLTGNNSYTGDTTIKSGVVDIRSYFGDFATNLILDGGGVVDRNNSVNFQQSILVGAGGGILRTYGSATTTFSGTFGNAPGVPSATLTHTDTGIQIFSGDGSAFQGTYVNARGSAYFDAADWPGTTLVNTDGTQLRFGLGTTTHIKALTTDRDVFVENGTLLNLVSGAFTASPGTTAEAFTVQGNGALTSSSGSLVFDFPTPFTAVTQSVSVKMEDYDGSTPLTVIKNGIGGIANFNQANNHTGGTIINGGRITATNQDAFGIGPVTVNSGGQAYLAATNGVYFNDMTIEGIGPVETAGNLGALRLDTNTSVTGQLTVAPAGARVVAYNGTTGSISGTLAGAGNLEINSASALHNGTVLLNAASSAYTGTLTVAQGRLNLRSTDFGGSITVASGATLGEEGIVAGSLALNGSILRLNGSTPEAITAGTLTLSSTVGVSLDNLPPDTNPILVANYTTLTGSVANLTTAAGSLARLAFTDTGTSITAQIVNFSRTWTGAASGVWDSSALNWQEDDQRFYSGDPVTFPDGAANRTITLPATVSPASVVFNNNTGNDYSVAGRMSLPTGGTFTKQGTGSVTLTGTPSIVPTPVTIQAGLLVLGTTNYQKAFGTCPEIIVNGGTLRLNGINLLYDSGSSHTVTANAGSTVELNAYHNHFKTLNINGGTIKGITANDSRYQDEYTTLDIAVNVGGSQVSTFTRVAGGTGVFSLGGAPFNVADATTGTDLLVNVPFVGGSLTKNGAGTMELREGSTYAGGTVINGGTLLANNLAGSATGGGAIIVNATGTLGGTGAITSSVGVESGGILSPGSGGIESLATGAINLKAGSTLAVDYNSSGTPQADSTAVTGNLTLAGSLSLTDLAAVSAPIATGVKLTLMTYSGTVTGTFAGLAEGSTFIHGANTFKIRYADAKKVTLESLTVAAAGYDGWSAQISDAGQRGRTQDPDGDGFTNLQEFLFGKNPSSKDGSLTTSDRTANGLVIRWSQRTSGTSYRLLESGTLANPWTQWIAPGAPYVIESDGPQSGNSTNGFYQPTKATIPLNQTKRFFRLEGVEN